MKTPTVQELRRAGHLGPDVRSGEREKALVARSLLAVREPRVVAAKPTRTGRGAA